MHFLNLIEVLELHHIFLSASAAVGVLLGGFLVERVEILVLSTVPGTQGPLLVLAGELGAILHV